MLMTSTLLTAPVAQPTANEMCMQFCELDFFNCIKARYCAKRFPLPIPESCMKERQECIRDCEETYT